MGQFGDKIPTNKALIGLGIVNLILLAMLSLSSQKELCINSWLVQKIDIKNHNPLAQCSVKLERTFDGFWAENLENIQGLVNQYQLKIGQFHQRILPVSLELNSCGQSVKTDFQSCFNSELLHKSAKNLSIALIADSNIVVGSAAAVEYQAMMDFLNDYLAPELPEKITLNDWEIESAHSIGRNLFIFFRTLGLLDQKEFKENFASIMAYATTFPVAQASVKDLAKSDLRIDGIKLQYVNFVTAQKALWGDLAARSSLIFVPGFESAASQKSNQADLILDARNLQPIKESDIQGLVFKEVYVPSCQSLTADKLLKVIPAAKNLIVINQCPETFLAGLQLQKEKFDRAKVKWGLQPLKYYPTLVKTYIDSNKLVSFTRIEVPVVELIRKRTNRNFALDDKDAICIYGKELCQVLNPVVEVRL